MAVFSANLLPAPMEPFPLDGGWAGLFLVLVNGFLLSLIVDRNKVGILERLLLSIGLGFGLTFVVMILLGVMLEISLLSVLLAQLMLLLVMGTFVLRRGFRFDFNAEVAVFKVNRQGALQAFLLAIIGVLGFTALYNALALPATEWDSLAYGVNYAKIIFQNGHIPLIAGPSIGIEMSAAYPPGVQLTAVSLYAFAGEANDFYYRMLSPIFSLATLLVTYKFAMLLNRNRTFSVYAVSALVMIPFFWELFIQETYLMALTLMLTSAAYFFYKAYESNPSDTKKYQVIAILFCGFASLTSYIGVLAFGMLLLYVARKKITAKQFGLLVALGLVIVLPWYLRNLVLLGNPAYPFLGIGNYLDPLLVSSTSQHFRQYTMIPLYAFSTLACKVGGVLLVVAIAVFTFSKRKEFRLALPLYLLLASVVIMAFHVAFPRYLILALPILAVIFSTYFKSIPKAYRLPQIISVVFIVLMVLASAVMLPYINTVKPTSLSGEDKTQYLNRIYEEGDAWQWINQNTPTNTRIATFDIKDYYLNRGIFYLDGNESAPLYHMSTIQECINYLQDRGVGYVLSVPWASPFSETMPPAYDWCLLTRYLGDPGYLPPVFVGVNWTAVYHVGPLDAQTISQAFEAKNMVAPLKQFSVNVTITNDTYPYMGEFYLPFPVDYYLTKNITVSAISPKPIEVHLYDEIMPHNATDNSINVNIAHSQYGLPENSMASFSWKIDQIGYFTIRVVDKEENFPEPFTPFNVTVNVEFINTPKSNK